MGPRKLRALSATSLAAVGIACSAVVALAVLAGKATSVGTEYRLLQARLLDARRMALASRPDSQVARRLVSESDLSTAIDELARRGRALGVNFLSITPKEALDSGKPAYKVVPIDLETRSTYEQLGTFLGTLDELERSIVTVESFTVAPEKDNPQQLETRLELHLFMASE